MKYYGVEMIGDFVCQIWSTLTDAGSASPEGRAIYVAREDAMYVADGTTWRPAAKTNFITLTDCPSAYVMNNLPIVNSAGTAIVFTPVSGAVIIDAISASLSASTMVRSTSAGVDRHIPVWEGNTRNMVTAHTSAYITSGGELYASKVYNAVWNDIADFIEVDCDIDYGYVYVMDENYRVSKSNKYCEMGIIGIASDTYGFGLGNKAGKTGLMPISIGGFVLAHVDAIYPSGTPLTSGPNGILTALLTADRMIYPERIVASFLKPECSDTWNGVSVNDRHWVKVK